MKVKLDLEKCIGCGTCDSVCPDVFTMGDDMKAHLKDGQASGQIEEKEITDSPCLEEAADTCAVEAIEVEK